MCFVDENQICLKAAAAEKIINGCMWWRAADIWILFAFHGPVAFIKTSHSTFSAHWFPFCLLTFFLKRVQEQKAKGCSRLVSLRGTYTFYSFHSWHDTLFPFFCTCFFISQKYFDGVETSRTTKHFSQTQIALKGPIFPWINTNASTYIQLRNTCSLHTGLGRVHIMIHSCPLTCDTSRDSSYTGFKSCAVVLLPAFLFFFNFF